MFSSDYIICVNSLQLVTPWEVRGQCGKDTGSILVVKAPDLLGILCGRQHLRRYQYLLAVLSHTHTHPHPHRSHSCRRAWCDANMMNRCNQNSTTLIQPSISHHGLSSLIAYQNTQLPHFSIPPVFIWLNSYHSPGLSLHLLLPE